MEQLTAVSALTFLFVSAETAIKGAAFELPARISIDRSTKVTDKASAAKLLKQWTEEPKL
jgi:hypothetical protein